ncbi:MAG: protein kinase [Anaerolineales bacterium]|nr:protein kinase [Anaerolineales bacterium]
MADLVGKTVGKYRIVARLGRGGMAEVYKAYQPGLDRYVGIKVLHAHLVDDKDFIGRFEREALAVGKLRHPNIVQALDFDREGEMYFMAMEFIDGPTLKDELKARRTENNPFSLKEVSLIFTALCSAIDYAHSRSMVHRDLKPANVMINQEGQIVLTDFGIARIIGATQYTQTGALSGTPAYMSPEQGQGERGDERSDIYSLGVMLYEMVTGVVPFDGDTPFAVIMKHISEPLPLPTRLNPNIPEGIERVILKAMSKNPSDRYQTAGEMARALRDAIGVAPGEESLPLKVVAPKPEIHQIDHATGFVTAAEKAATMASTDGGATVVTPNTTTGTLVAPAKGGLALPLIIGGVVALLLILAAIAFFALGSGNGSARATETAIALFNATQTAVAEAGATQTFVAVSQATQLAEVNTQATAAAESAAPTQTAAAALAQAEATAALQTAVAQAAEGVISAQNATATAGAIALAATNDAVTAEAVANATPTPEATEPPTPEPPTDTPPPSPTPTVGPPPDTPTPTTPPDTPTPERPPISGKLAFPVDNGSGRYDVFIYSIPDGNQLGKIDGARQPNFRLDGVKLLVNGQGSSFGENVLQANATGGVEGQVSGAPQDAYPFYKPDGSTLTYSNPELAVGSDGNRHDYLFVQCSLKPPSQESDKCVEMSQWNLIVPAGQIGEVQGRKPVWTAGDRLVYSGCNTWAGGGSCGIFGVGSWATKRTSGGETPVKLLDGASAAPTDAKNGLVAFHSRESGTWEAFVMAENGAGVVNISNGPNSSDGLPTFSPDGQWVAFASDREGAWAVFVAPINGGPAQKLFDFPKANPWGTGGGRDWTEERMSWGP